MNFRSAILVSIIGSLCAGACAGESFSDVVLRARKDPSYLTSFMNRPGFDISATDSEGRSLILWAAQAGEADMIRTLVKRGADVNQISKGKYQVTPLVCAADRGWTATVATLIELGAAVKGEAGFGAVHCASSYDTDNHAKIILILARAGAALDSPKEPEKSPLKDAIGRHKCLAALLQGGANVNARYLNDETLLIYAVISGDSIAVKIILQSKPDLNAKVKFPFNFTGVTDTPREEWYNDRTALMCAAENGRLDIVKMLAEAGADILIKDRHGKTATDLARQSGKTLVVDYLGTNTSNRGAGSD